jgi:hypothetical protein
MINLIFNVMENNEKTAITTLDGNTALIQGKKKYRIPFMKMHCILTVGLLLNTAVSSAQDVSLALQRDPAITPTEKNAQWQALKNGVGVGFLNSNKHYAPDRVPEENPISTITLVAWKNEKIHTQLGVWATKDVPVEAIAGTLTSTGGAVIPPENVQIGLVNYVRTGDRSYGCGQIQQTDPDSSLVEDIIDLQHHKGQLKPQQVQPFWLSITIPANAQAGNYAGTISVKAGKTYQLKFVVKVLDKVLPSPSQWAFQLDLWQHPAAVARVHQVPLWSDAHFNLMRGYYTMLAKAGQKCITAGIVNEPWGHQTYDDYPSLIKWTRKKDGSWQYDYSLFDKYISFVMGTGIDQRINCYSMVPWKVAFQYYDEGLRHDTVFTGKIGSDEYNAFWTPMLKDFTSHLKAKGWFAKTTIAMDERPMDAMKAVIKLLKGIDKDWKIALAGEYHPDIEKDIDDYCLASVHKFPADVLPQRTQQGKTSTWYTCCVEKYPNGFTFSPPAEHVWMGWYTAAQHMDGYLRWAYNSWTANPLADSRNHKFPAGDTYQVYPGPMSSIRFEKLVEGIQDFEKIRVLRKAYHDQGNSGKLTQLENALKVFEIKALERGSAEEMVLKVKPLINQ